MKLNNRDQIKIHKLKVFISLSIILFSTDIANIITYYSNYKNTEADCIRYQIAIIIPCLIISINSYINIFMNNKTNNNLDK